MEVDDEKTIWLIGKLTSTFPKGPPTTARNVLQVYYFHRLVLGKQKVPSVNSVAKDLIAHWSESGISTIESKDAARKIQGLIDKHDAYKKCMYRQSHTQKCNEQNFIDLLNDRFDIFSKKNYHHNKKQKLEPVTCEIVQMQPAGNDNLNAEIDVPDDDANYEQMEIDFETDNDPDYEKSLSKYQQSKFSIQSSGKPTGVIQKIIDSPDISSVLDRTGYSSPNFTILCGVMAGVIGENLKECTLSTSTVNRRRKTHRDQIVTVIKDDYISSVKSNIVVHWDGKKLNDATNNNVALRKKKIERLAVVVSGGESEKILTIAKTEDGTGIVIADTVYQHVLEWNVLDAIVAICTDTTASNTGIYNGSVVLFQQLLQRNVLYFACRHHVDEVIIGGVYIGLFGESTGPSPDIFENFKRDWPIVNQESFKPLDAKIFKRNVYINSLKEGIMSYVENILQTKKGELKGDYSEMLELCLIVLGKPMTNYTFHTPHACSNSRWMAKIIYSMKMFLFRGQLNFSRAEITNLESICLFVCLIYVKHWVQCCSASNAPHNDLALMKDLERYSAINKKVSSFATQKFKEHLWYLGSELVVLSLFSDKVADSVKSRMFERMKNLDDGQWTKRNCRLLDSADVTKKELYDLVDSSSMTVLKSLKLDIQFMFESESSVWKNMDSYKSAKKIVDSFRVVNDCAERTLKLMTDVNESMTSKEYEKQQCIQVIEDNRKRIPNAKKSVLLACPKHSFD